MNKLKTLIIASMASLLSLSAFSSFAAQKLEETSPLLEKIAVISVLNADTPEQLDEMLSDKAAEWGASRYYILMNDSTHNSERGTAEIYR